MVGFFVRKLPNTALVGGREEGGDGGVQSIGVVSFSFRGSGGKGQRGCFVSFQGFSV